jgi:electron transfer flavoprotein alpha subunit
MTGSLLIVPDEADVALVDEARRLAEQLADEGGAPASAPDADADLNADADPGSSDAPDGRPTVVAVALDGVVDPAAIADSAPDEVVHLVRSAGAFATGAAGVSVRAAALASLVADEHPTAVLLPDSPDGDDLAAATARRVRGGCVTDCLLRVRDGELLAGRAAYGGRAYAEISFEGGPPVVTLNTEALGSPASAPAASPRERTVEVSVEDGSGVRRLGVVDVPEQDLSRARRIVAGGYGLGGPDGFEVVEDLADALGAAVGASRPPADEKWVPYDRQIGVTGKEIDVELYVPLAISGDSYHMRSVNADTLVPINTDPDARIFTFADLGVVGDAYEYAPAVAAAIRQAVGPGAADGDGDSDGDGDGDRGEGASDADPGADGGNGESDADPGADEGEVAR